MKTKVLKVKIGEVFEDGKSKAVYQTAWPRKLPDGTTMYEIRTPIFINEIEIADKSEKKPTSTLDV